MAVRLDPWAPINVPILYFVFIAESLGSGYEYGGDWWAKGQDLSTDVIAQKDLHHQFFLKSQSIPAQAIS